MLSVLKLFGKACSPVPGTFYSARARVEPPEHQNNIIVPTSTRHNSTNIDQIQEAIEHLELHKARDNFSYRKVAKIFGVN
jgi:hypothetical protein